MTEAESYFNETTYLINIAEKTGEVISELESIVYKDVLTTRNGSNWHICDYRHCEVPHNTAYNLQYKYFETIGKARE